MSKNISRKFAALSAPQPSRRVAATSPPPTSLDQAFLAYNGGRLREAARLLVEKKCSPATATLA